MLIFARFVSLGVRVDQKIIPLSSDRCMLAPTHDSLTFAMAQQQQQQSSARHAPNSGNGEGENSGALVSGCCFFFMAAFMKNVFLVVFRLSASSFSRESE